MTDIGPLAAALAKAQTAFPTVTRDKTVTVQTKSGGSYSFKYAPLDSILNAVRAPLSDNGLVIVQLLDEGALVTSLVHESGALLSGRIDIPAGGDIQALGSAITYLRRYAIQAMLGIAAEDDDDGNRAAGNRATDEQETKQVGGETLELLGRVDVRGVAREGGSQQYKGDWRESPDGPVIGFRLARSGDDNDMPQVLIVGDIAASLKFAEPDIIGKQVRVKGRLYAVKSPGRRAYNRLVIGEADGHFIETPDLRIPADPATPSEPPAGDGAQPEAAPTEAPSEPLFEPLDDEERAAVAGTLP